MPALQGSENGMHVTPTLQNQAGKKMPAHLQVDDAKACMRDDKEEDALGPRWQAEAEGKVPTNMHETLSSANAPRSTAAHLRLPAIGPVKQYGLPQEQNLIGGRTRTM